MKTGVLMQRKIFDEIINQDSKNNFFSITDLVRAGNKWRVKNGMEPFYFNRWVQNKSVKEFILELEKKINKKPLISGRGRGNHSWAHPFLFIDIALSISPELKINVYEWIFDELIKYRNDSGDSYKKMAGALFLNCRVKSNFSREIIVIAEEIKNACGVFDWQTANESQLKLRDKIHENISLLCDVLKNNKKAVEFGIENAKKTIKKEVEK